MYVSTVQMCLRTVCVSHRGPGARPGARPGGPGARPGAWPGGAAAVCPLQAAAARTVRHQETRTGDGIGTLMSERTR